MALIRTDRHTSQDLHLWERLERQDLAHEVPEHKIRSAANVIAEWHRLWYPDYVISTSWGKDSVVVLHLAITVLGDEMPEVRHGINAKPGRQPNPDSFAVRNAMLARFPHIPYRELTCRHSLQRDLAPEFEGRAVLGIRADESRARRISAAKLGPMGETTCRPILRWSSADVFAYLARHDLPVHPAYGYLSLFRDWGPTPRQMRDRIRVHSIGGDDGGAFRREWEAEYYPDEVEAIAAESGALT